MIQGRIKTTILIEAEDELTYHQFVADTLKKLDILEKQVEYGRFEEEYVERLDRT